MALIDNCQEFVVWLNSKQKQWKVKREQKTAEQGGYCCGSQLQSHSTEGTWSAVDAHHVSSQAVYNMLLLPFLPQGLIPADLLGIGGKQAEGVH